MFFMSGSQGQTFAIAAHTMTERIRKLGPSPFKIITEEPAQDAETRTSPVEAHDTEQTDFDSMDGFRGRK
jgi:hypothetical protein